MSAISARVPFARLTSVNPFARLAARRRTLPRPPAFIVVCATVTVLNIVGLVMILSASSVAALSDYGSSWYFFNRQLLWAIVGALAFVFAARQDRGAHDDERELRELARLHTQGTRSQPAARSFDVDPDTGLEHRREQSERDDEQRRRRAAPAPVVEARREHEC